MSTNNSNYDKEQVKEIIIRELSALHAEGALDDDIAASEREQQAESALTVSDLRRIEDAGHESASGYILDRYGLNVEDFDSERELHAAVAEKRSELREQQRASTPGRSF